MKKSFKYLAFLIALLICVTAISCVKPEGDDKDTTTVGGDDQTNDTEPGDIYEKDDLPAGLDYNSDVNILHWDEGKRVEFEAETQSGDLANDAVYKRNLNMEERLGINLVWYPQPGNNDHRNEFVNVVAANYKAGDRAYDVIATYSRTSGLLAVDGYLANYNHIDDSYLDFNKPWWPEHMLDTVTIGNAVYFITGDAATSVLHYMTAIFYNKDLMESYGIQYPSVDVENNTWTLDRLVEITSNYYQDLDSDSKLSDADFYGFTTIYYNADGFYTGSGLRLVDHDPENLLKISDDFMSEKAVNLVDKLGDWLTTNTCYVSRSGSVVDYYTPFGNGTALTCQLRAFMVDPTGPVSLTNVEWEFGVVPTPKFDENQDDYITIIGNPFTMFSIMNDISDERQEMCTAVLECWGSEAYRNTTPAVFEDSMKLKYSPTEVEAAMYDVVRRGVNFDLGRIFANHLSSMSSMPSNAMATGGSWATLGAIQQRSLNLQLKKVTDSLIDQQG